MCESLDSASAKLAIDLAIERQRLQIERELARARFGRGQQPASHQSESNSSLVCVKLLYLFSQLVGWNSILDSITGAQLQQSRMEDCAAQGEQPRQIGTADVSMGEAF